jgi:cytochrome bd-type quinol oxidase subunit 2
MDHGSLFAIIFPLVLLALPVAIGLVGWARTRGEPRPVQRPVARRLTLQSLLAYVLAFNITFFIQELFLVVPKALTPGLKPTLYHNNHNWDGTHPLERLFQGTGAAAILVCGLVFAWLAKRGAGRTEAKRLFVLWMAYHGLFQSLPQIAFASVGPDSDTGQALDWFAVSAAGETTVTVVGIAAIIGAGLFMTARFLEMAQRAASGRERGRFAFFLAVLPAVLAIPILILFRIPREWEEVIIPTIAVPLIGLIWVQATAWRTKVEPMPAQPSPNLALPFVLVFVLLAFFQLVLRPGIPFY